MSFFNTLNYSSCNEDGLAELRALEISPGDTVCCITGSGDRVFHMLLGNPAQVLAFDLNPAQNYLLELKSAAIRDMDYSGFVQFLGLHPAMKSRWDSYLGLRLQLTPDAVIWFDARRGMIERGILYEGRWERYFRMSSYQLRCLRKNKIRQLFEFNDLAKQRQFLYERWNTWGWRLLLRLTFNRLAFRFALGDPGFYAYANDQRPPWKYIYDRMTSFLEHHLARSSFMMALIFQGRFVDPFHYPPYLREENFALIKSRLQRITIRTASLFDMLTDKNNKRCNKYSLSDVSSFLDAADYQRLFEFFATKQGIRFCLRDFLTQRVPPPKEISGPIRFLTELQDNLAIDDTSFGYTFIIGVND